MTLKCWHGVYTIYRTIIITEFFVAIIWTHSHSTLAIKNNYIINHIEYFDTLMCVIHCIHYNISLKADSYWQFDYNYLLYDDFFVSIFFLSHFLCVLKKVTIENINCESIMFVSLSAGWVTEKKSHLHHL